MLETVRARLTLWYVSLLAAILVVVLVMIYVLLARALYVRIDDSLRGRSSRSSATSLANDLAEGQSVDDAARSTASELASRSYLVAIYDGSGRLLGEAGREDDIVIPLPPLDDDSVRRQPARCSPSSKPTTSTIAIGSRCGG